MAEEQLSAFTAKVQEDPALQNALRAATSADQVVAIAADHGFTITTDDLTPPDVDVSDAELQEAAGGEYYVLTYVHRHTAAVFCGW
ncbi:MAG: Nif11-like leader peptide family natural product precursor [Actinomycetes bacterium]